MKVIIDGIEYMPIPVKPKGENLSHALDLRMDESDAGDNISIRDYLRLQLETLWQEGESFSGKRPFGNSGWEYDLQATLIKGGFIKGEVDEEYGDVINCDTQESSLFVLQLIREAFKET